MEKGFFERLPYYFRLLFVILACLGLKNASELIARKGKKASHG